MDTTNNEKVPLLYARGRRSRLGVAPQRGDGVVPHDRRAITSPLNGKKGGRPRVWNVNPYDHIKWCKQNPSPQTNETRKELEQMLERRRREKLRQNIKRISRATNQTWQRTREQIEYQKKLRARRLMELRYLRQIVRRIMESLEESKDLDPEVDWGRPKKDYLNKS